MMRLNKFIDSISKEYPQFKRDVIIALVEKVIFLINEGYTDSSDPLSRCSIQLSEDQFNFILESGRNIVKTYEEVLHPGSYFKFRKTFLKALEEHKHKELYKQLYDKEGQICQVIVQQVLHNNTLICTLEDAVCVVYINDYEVFSPGQDMVALCTSIEVTASGQLQIHMTRRGEKFISSLVLWGLGMVDLTITKAVRHPGYFTILEVTTEDPEHINNISHHFFIQNIYLHMKMEKLYILPVGASIEIALRVIYKLQPEQFKIEESDDVINIILEEKELIGRIIGRHGTKIKALHTIIQKNIHVT